MSSISRSPNYLTIKHNAYYFRIRVPEDLMALLNRREFKYSLRPSLNLRAARRRAMMGGAVASALFARLRMRETNSMGQLDDEQIRLLADRWIRNALREGHEYRINRDRPITEAEFESYAVGLDEGLSQFAEALLNYDLNKTAPDAVTLLTEQGLAVGSESLDFKSVCYALLQKGVEFCQIEGRRLGGDYTDAYANPARFLPSPAQPEAVEPSAPLSEALSDYIADKERQKEWTKGTILDNSAILERFVRFVDDPPCNYLTAEQMLLYKHKLSNWPSNCSKRKQYRKKSHAEIWALAQAGKIPERHLFHPTSLANNYNKVRTFLRWATMKPYCAEVGLADTLPAPRKKSTPVSLGSRRPLNDSDLGKLFAQDSFTKFTNAAPWRLWVPLLALYTGARLNELCQAEVMDLRVIDDTWTLRITALFGEDEEVDPEEKSVKTRAGNRIVPLHPFLVDVLRFPAYATRMEKRGKGRLFPELRQNSKGNYGHYASKVFGDYKRSVGLGTGKVFHSFRNTVIDWLKQRGVAEVMRKEYVGHEVKDVHNDYPNAYYIKNIMEEVIPKLDFQDLLGLDYLKENKWVRGL